VRGGRGACAGGCTPACGSAEGAFGPAVYGMAEEAAEKVDSGPKNVPQWLKPDCREGTYGTAEARAPSRGEFQQALKEYPFRFVAGLERAVAYIEDATVAAPFGELGELCRERDYAASG
jgi:hypothetical protein